MPRIELAPEIFDDFDRFFDHMDAFEVEDAPERIAELLQGVQILARNPLVGRPVKGGTRELVIGQGARGYVALYRFVAPIDTVFVLTIGSQRESGYKRKRRRRPRPVQR
jgi:plasmid stabilization system protein ParE